MDEIAVSTVVYLPQEEVYEFLADFPRYANYSKYLKEVRRRGDGGDGTRYLLRFSWWKLSYTVHSEVTDVDPPRRIDWRVVKDIRARGYWRVEPLDEVPADAPPDAETACRVRFVVRFDPDSAREDAFDLPRFVSLDRVVRKIVPVVEDEAENVVERVVADIEGRPREVDLVVEKRSVDG